MSAVPPTHLSKSPNKTSPQDGPTTRRNVTELLGRVLLVTLFLTSGVGKVATYTSTIDYMASAGVPGALLPLAVAVDIVGAFAIMLGWKTRVASFLLAGYALLTGMLFHSNFADQMQIVMFLKNLSIAGAFLILTANGAGQYSVDARKAN